MVHPLMRQSPPPSSSASAANDTDPAAISSRIIDMLPRLHVLVVGPGLGRDPLMHETLARVLAAARERRMPVVMDADSLALVTKTPELVMGWKEVVLTPNVVEFGRLWKGIKSEDQPKSDEKKPSAQVEALSRALGGVTIIQKGGMDYISDGETTLTVDVKGGLKRSGGQGDTLTGSIATILAWRGAYVDRLWDHGGRLRQEELLSLAAFGGAAITRVGFSILFYFTSILLILFSSFLSPLICARMSLYGWLTYVCLRYRNAPASPLRSMGALCRLAI